MAVTEISDRMMGCSTPTPLLAAIAPMMNGKTVPPVPPIAMAKPIALTWICFGSSLAVIITAPGNIGPRKKPKKATATAETTN